MKEDTIIFVHGAWHGKWCWDKYFRQEFTKNGYDVITFDLPGHSNNGKIKGINKYSIRDYVNSLKEEVNKLKNAPIIIGHSMGGLILQKYLEENTCKKAIFLASVPPSGILKATLKFAKRWYLYESLLSRDLYGIINTEQKCKDAFFSDDIPEDELKEYTSKLCSESFKAYLEMVVPKVKVTKNSKIPILVIGAKNDNIITMDDNKKTAKKYNAELINVDNIAHDMMLDKNHEKVSQQIINWLKK